MIKQNARLRIERIPLSKILATKVDVRFPATLNGYIQALIEHPECDLEPIHVQPHSDYAGLYALENGYHRWLAAIATGRSDVACIVEEEDGVYSQEQYIHELEHCLQSCIDFMSHPAMVDDEHKEWYTSALCSKGLKLLRREHP